MVIEAAKETQGEIIPGPYFIGKLEQFDIDTTPTRLYKSNFKGHDRGLVTAQEIHEIVKKELFTNIERIEGDQILRLRL